MTTNLADFGRSQLKTAAQLLTAWSNSELDFLYSQDGVQVALNQQSGNVFLTNSEHEVIMLNSEGKAELFFSDGYIGQEGFKSDILAEFWDFDGYESDRLEWIYDTVLSESKDKDGEFLSLLIDGIKLGNCEALDYLLNNTDKVSEDWTEQAITPMFEKLDLSFLDGIEKTNLFRLVEAQDFDLALNIVGLDSLEDLQKQVY